MSFKDDFQLFIGGKTGILKGIVLKDQVLIKNLQNVKNLKTGSEITVMTWGDPNEVDVLMGTREQSVKIYDTEFKSFTSSMQTKFGTGPIVGLTRFDDVITTCSASGHIRVWKYNQEKAIEININGEVEKMETSKVNSGIIGTGGRNNDLCVWDLERKEKTFIAKNVKHNELNLAVPIWVSDLKFLPESEGHIALCSRFGHVRMYDVKAQRRPVIDITIPDQSLQCIALTCREHQAIVGSGTGYMLSIDFRMTGNNRITGSFKGATGSIRQIDCHKTKPYVASVGLDSYFRLHNIFTKAKLKEKFMHVKLNAVLMRASCSISEEEAAQVVEAEVKDTSEATVEMDAMFNGMDTIGGKRRRLSKTS